MNNDTYSSEVKALALDIYNSSILGYWSYGECLEIAKKRLSSE